MIPLDHPKVMSDTDPTRNFSYCRAQLDSLKPRMIAELELLRPYYAAVEAGVSTEQTDERSPFWNNRFFSKDDARLAYAMVRRHTPQRIVEIGCGNSTKFFRKAIEDGRLKTQLQCIDPQPRTSIAAVADTIVRSTLQEVAPEFFSELQPGSILFFDGSHLVLPGTDTPYFFMEVLPRLKPGVIVHIHDICLPYEYMDGFSSKGYGEQYMLATLLAHAADKWQTTLAGYYLHKEGLLKYGSSSYWLRRS
jgi:predicted O-methyltransferase YrrM